MQRRESGLGAPLAVGHAEVPVEHLVVPAVPLVGVGEDECARAAAGECGVDLGADHGRLLLASEAAAVGAQLGEQQRAVAGQVLEARDVAADAGGVVQVDVEREHVDERQPQVLGARVVHVGQQPAAVDLANLAAEPLEKPFHPVAAVPAHDRRRDLVSDRVAEERGVTSTALGLGGDPGCDVGGAPAVVEEGDVLLPGQAGHHPETVVQRGIEQPRWRRRVRPHRVDALRGHGGEVGIDLRAGAEPLALAVGAKGAVGDASHPQPLVADGEKLPVDTRSRPHPNFWHRARRAGRPPRTGRSCTIALPAPFDERPRQDMLLLVDPWVLSASPRRFSMKNL